MKSIDKKILIGYFVILIFGLILFLTGYSFTIDYLNYILFGVIVIYPIIRLFLLIKSVRTRLIVGIVSAIGIVVLGFYSVVFLIFASSGTVYPINSWEIDNYEIKIVSQQDWAGPSYRKYLLKHYVLNKTFEKSLATYFLKMMKWKSVLLN